MTEPTTTAKTQNAGNNIKTTKSSKKSTTIKSTTVKSTTNKTEYDSFTTKFDVNAFSDYGYTDTDETAIIISVIAVGVFVILIMLVHRNLYDDKRHNYTDDDKGCD